MSRRFDGLDEYTEVYGKERTRDLALEIGLRLEGEFDSEYDSFYEYDNIEEFTHAMYESFNEGTIEDIEYGPLRGLVAKHFDDFCHSVLDYTPGVIEYNDKIYVFDV